MAMIKERISRIQDDIHQICQKLGRKPQDVTLVGVTKYASPDQIQEAIAAGLKHIAENKVQEAVQKFPQFSGVTKHFIGHLQANKVKTALQLVDLIQSIDNLKLAQEIQKQAAKLNRQVDILIQVNTSGEKQKFGIDPQKTLRFIEEISQLDYIRVLGLMTMAPLTDNEKIIHDCFGFLRKIRDEVAKHFFGSSKVQMKNLSMGMTDDYKIALEEGSNMVRIGRAIFGE